MRRAILASLFASLTIGAVLVAEAFQPTLAFWQTGSQVFATTDSADLLPQISNDLRARSVPIGGWGIIEYKAVVITSGTCTSAGVGASLLSAPTSSSALPFTFTPPADTVDAYFTVCVIGKNFVGVWQRETTPTSSYTLHINTELPVVNSITLNNGTTPSPKARVPVSLSLSHPRLNVTHFCLKSRLSAVALPTPAADDACWYAVNNPSPGKTPSPSVSFAGFIFNLGFSTGDYYVYAWAKAESGAVSYLSSLGNGTFGADKQTIRFVQGSPPVIINAQATVNDSPTNPVSDADLTIPAGQTVVIKWNASDDKSLPSNAITLSFTLDENAFTQIVSGISNTAHSGCTIDSNYTGCYVWTNGSPSSGYFKIRVSATDDSSLESSASAVPNNATPFRLIAGNTDTGLNSSASAAIIFPKASDLSSTASNAGCLAVTDDGVVYTVDRRGLMRIDVTDGRYRQYIPVTGTTNVGPVSSATLRIRPRKIALDYNDGLLIYDYEQILRLDLKTEVLSVFIGGGSTLADNTPATSYVVTAPTNFDAATTLMPLPNGDVWFTSGLGIGRARNGSHIEVYTASDQRVHWKTPTGLGSKENSSFDPSPENIRGYGFGFNPTNSSITYVRSVSTVPYPGGQSVYSVRYNPTTFATMAPQIPYLAYWDADPTVTSRLGEMYALDRFEKNGLYKYNSTTNDWDRVVGTGVKGSCADGTPATSCNVDIYDAFISAQGLIYIVDRNLIRTVDSDGNMLTLFGQSLSFGDGGAGPSARISEIQWLDQTNNGKIVFADVNEFRIREFTPGGSISHLAGTGADAYPNTTDPAATQPVSVKYWGGTYSLVVDQSDNGVLFMRAGARFTKLNRSTGRWDDIAGGGTTDYASADGLSGSQIFLNGYPPSPYGYNGSHFISHLDKWDGAQHIDAMIKQYAINDGTQSHLIGKTGPSAGDFSALTGAAPGTNASTLSISPNFSALTRVEWDSSQTAWLIHQPGSSIIKPVRPTGVVEATMNFPRAFSGYTRVIKGGDTIFYYCANDARIYRYNYTSGIETALAWPSATLFCSGFSLVWNPSRNSVIFPIQQNGLGGIAEIYDP